MNSHLGAVQAGAFSCKRLGNAGLALAVVLTLTTGTNADTITAEMRRDDPRLTRRVTLSAARIYVGDLLEQLGRQTMLSLSADERDGAADQIVTAYLRDVPLNKALDALWSLLSYKGATFHWQRERSGSEFAYRLRRPPLAQQLAIKLNEDIQHAFESEATILETALTLPPDELDRLADRDERVARFTKSPPKRDGLRTFFESVPAEARLAVLKGQREFRVAVANLSESGRAFVFGTWKAYDGFKIRSDGSREPLPEPSWIQFRASRGPGNVPSLFADIEGIGGYTYLGGPPLQRSLIHELAARWRLPGDDEDIPSQRLLEAPPDPTRQDLQPLLPRRLNEFSEAAQVSILARLPANSAYVRDPGSPHKQSISTYLARISDGLPPNLMHKWRHGTLLLTHAGWYHEPIPAPWRLVKAVYGTSAGKRGWFDLGQLIELAGSFSQDEVRALAQEFKVLRALVSWHSLFSFLARQPAIAKQALSEEGAPIGLLFESMRPIRELAVVLRKGDELQGARVRLFESPDLGGSIVLRVFGVDGKELGGAGFVNRRPPNPQSQPRSSVSSPPLLP